MPEAPVPETTPEISVVVPCYNEQGNIDPLISELQAVLEKIGRPFEVIYVNDASTDNTLNELLSLKPRYPFLRVINHKSNHGESAGFLTGIENARGEIVVTMDGDLQNDPTDIPAMLELLKENDAVAGVRRKRDDSFSKRFSSRIANRVRGWLLNDDIHDAGCTFRAIRRDAMAELPPFRALHRFTPTILKARGFRVVEMLVNHRARTRGVSKYGIGNRLWVGIADIRGMRWYVRRMFPPHRGEEIFEQPKAKTRDAEESK